MSGIILQAGRTSSQAPVSMPFGVWQRFVVHVFRPSASPCRLQTWHLVGWPMTVWQTDMRKMCFDFAESVFQPLLRTVQFPVLFCRQRYRKNMIYQKLSWFFIPNRLPETQSVWSDCWARWIAGDSKSLMKDLQEMEGRQIIDDWMRLHWLKICTFA